MALKLKLNEPVQLMLTRKDPKIYQTDGRTSYMYSVILADGTEEKAFLSKQCADTITELQIQPRELFTLVRRKTAEEKEFFDLHTIAKEQTSRALAPLPDAQPAPKPPQTASSSHQTRASSIMGAALIAAIDAAALARQYAESKGLAVEFGPEDLRAIANTIYIQACKDPLFQERTSAAA